MLLLFETAAGYAVFQVSSNKALKPENIDALFDTTEHARKAVHLVGFKEFTDMADALEASAALVESKMSKDLKKALKKFVTDDSEQLGVADAKLGSMIKDKMGIQCVFNSTVTELMRGVRTHIDSLMGDIPKSKLSTMSLGLAHSLSRYKLKFSPDKVDTMIVQAISILDDLDKEINNYVMRCREWYGWHFPEVNKLIQDHIAYVKTIKLMGLRQNAKDTDFSEILTEELEARLKEEAEMSMGTDISISDIENIRSLCQQIIDISEFRTQLHEYMKNRMAKLAPNLTSLVGEIVGSRLIAHAGSLVNLAKYPASTIQILGAEKALFRALKTKRDTPKYGLIYHAQMIGQSATNMKGKVSRMLAAKAALATRIDALREGDELADIGIEHRAYLERRIGVLKNQSSHRVSGQGKAQAKHDNVKHEYDTAADSTMPHKRKTFGDDEGANPASAKKPKLDTSKVKEEEDDVKPSNGNGHNMEVDGTNGAHAGGGSEKKKKKKKSKAASDADSADE